MRPVDHVLDRYVNDSITTTISVPRDMIGRFPALWTIPLPNKEMALRSFRRVLELGANREKRT